MHTKKILRWRISIVFYNITTLYFKASEPDDYRIPGFNKDGKHQQPQIMIGLLVSSRGYSSDYQIFKCNTAETKTLIPVLESFEKRNLKQKNQFMNKANISQLKKQD